MVCPPYFCLILCLFFSSAQTILLFRWDGAEQSKTAHGNVEDPVSCPKTRQKTVTIDENHCYLKHEINLCIIASRTQAS